MPPKPDHFTSCYDKQDKKYKSLQSAWEDCEKDELCQGVCDENCDHADWRVCYGEEKPSNGACFHRRTVTPYPGMLLDVEEGRFY